MAWRSRSILAVVVVATICGSGMAGAVPRPPRPPEQPANGPGGAAFLYEGVDAERVGAPPDGYWVFRPSHLRLDATADESSLPVVIFFHGFTALDPVVYRSWIDHIVRRGAIVIYPDFQDNHLFDPEWSAFQDNAFAAIRAARDSMTGKPWADWNRVAVIGHSLGGVLAANYAALAVDEGLPRPHAMMLVEPGGCAGCDPVDDDDGIPLAALGGVAADIVAYVMVGADDVVVGDGAAKRIWADLASVPLDRRDYITVHGDVRGVPFLRATHLFPQTDGVLSTVDALDWFGTWKFFDLLADCTFNDQRCDIALNDTDEQRFMGLWSDGEFVTGADITDDP